MVSGKPWPPPSKPLENRLTLDSFGEQAGKDNRAKDCSNPDKEPSEGQGQPSEGQWNPDPGEPSEGQGQPSEGQSSEPVKLHLGQGSPSPSSVRPPYQSGNQALAQTLDSLDQALNAESIRSVKTAPSRGNLDSPFRNSSGSPAGAGRRTTREGPPGQDRQAKSSPANKSPAQALRQPKPRPWPKQLKPWLRQPWLRQVPWLNPECKARMQ